MSASRLKTSLINFITNNERAGVDKEVVDICAAYARHCIRKGVNVRFYNPEPNLIELLSNPALSDKQKADLQQFHDNQLKNQIDERVVRVCIAYAGILLSKGAVVLYNQKHLAKRLKISFSFLNYLASNEYKYSTGYTTIKIPKLQGFRQIDAPDESLKSIQRWILNNILGKIKIHLAAHGYILGRSIISNAKAHEGADTIVKLDLKDFFPTITFPRVLGIYLDIGYAYNIAHLLTRLTVYDGRLPQGAPTSPALSNLVCRKMDARLLGLSRKLGYTYTRYADDLTFSTSKYISPDKIVNISRQIIQEEGFELSPQKLQVQRKGSRHSVTGIIVNEKASVLRNYRKNLRAILHNSKTKGLESQNRGNHPDFLNYLRGMVAFVKSVDPVQAEPLEREFETIIQLEANK